MMKMFNIFKKRKRSILHDFKHTPATLENECICLCNKEYKEFLKTLKCTNLYLYCEVRFIVEIAPLLAKCMFSKFKIYEARNHFMCLYQADSINAEIVFKFSEMIPTANSAMNNVVKDRFNKDFVSFLKEQPLYPKVIMPYFITELKHSLERYYKEKIAQKE